MKNYSTFIFLFLSFSSQLHPMHPDEAAKKHPFTVGLTKIMKNKFTSIDLEKGVKVEVVDPSDEIVTLVADAVKKCKIEQPVIVLQCNKTLQSKDDEITSYAAAAHHSEFPTIRYLLISNDKNGPHEFDADIYHECGHTYYKDSEKFEPIIKNSTKLCLFGLASFAMAAGVQYSKLPEFWKFYSTGSAALLLYNFRKTINKFADVGVCRFYQRYTERRADRFAYENLIKEKKYPSIVYLLKRYLDDHISGKHIKFYGWSCTHPEDLERLKNGLSLLKKCNVSIDDLFNDPEVQKLYDEQTRNNFVAHLKKLFSDLIFHDLKTPSFFKTGDERSSSD